MIVGPKTVAETEFICASSIPVMDAPYLCVPRPNNLQIEGILEVSSPSSPIFRDGVGASNESVVSCLDTIKASIFECKTVEFFPRIRSGSYADIGPRPSMDDEHTCIDDLSAQLGSHFRCPSRSAFYGVFDGHGGPEAASYVRRNAMKLFFEDASLPDAFDFNGEFLQELEDSHRRAFLQADLALADDCSVSDSCGTTALTALVLGRLLLVANVGDCRAVLCRRGQAIQMSQDHRPSYLPERMRVEKSGGFIDDGYLNGCLAVTRALGDWEMKLPRGSPSPLIAEPDVQSIMLTEDDEFLILGCDGIWDAMSNQHAVSLVRRALRRHDDPRLCARELVMEALRLDASDNLTAVVICLAPPERSDAANSPRKPRLRCCSLSEEARNKLKKLLECN